MPKTRIYSTILQMNIFIDRRDRVRIGDFGLATRDLLQSQRVGDHGGAGCLELNLGSQT